MSTYIIYPEARYVSDEQIKSWYEDAMLDGQIDGEWVIDTSIANIDHDQYIKEMAAALDDAGIITLGREPR